MRAVVILGAAALLLLSVGALAGASPDAAGGIVQPAPPVTAGAFPLEATGKAPSDGDGLIPNPATPTGSPVRPPSSCSVTFTASGTVTSATVNAWIASNENSITSLTTVCLSGTFGQPLHVWSKSSTVLLELAPQPGQTATLDLGPVQAADTDPNQVLVRHGRNQHRGLTQRGRLRTDRRELHLRRAGTRSSRDLRDRTERHGHTNQAVYPHLSACYLNGGSCSDVFILDNTVEDVTNTADESTTDKSVGGNANANAYGIAVISAGSSSNEVLQHVVVEGNTVSGTRTGQSETITLNGDLEDFLEADNVIGPADNIGIDTIGWETGRSQARHGLVEGNTVHDVDTHDNTSSGRWSNGTCAPRPENAAGIYNDGASYIWIAGNLVWKTDQGIDFDVETASRSTDYLLVSGNTVHDDPGTSTGDRSDGTEPPGVPGSFTVAGNDFVGLYVDAFGSNASISDVYVHDNTIENQSQCRVKKRLPHRRGARDLIGGR